MGLINWGKGVFGEIKEGLGEAVEWVDQGVDEAAEWAKQQADTFVDWAKVNTGGQDRINIMPDNFSMRDTGKPTDAIKPFVQYPVQTALGMVQDANTYKTEAWSSGDVSIPEAVKDVGAIWGQRLWDSGLASSLGVGEWYTDTNATANYLLDDMQVKNETARHIANIVDLISNPDKWNFK